MKPLLDQLAMYHSYHLNRTNKLTHFIGVPMIIFSMMIPLHWLRLDWPFFALLIFYYMRLDKTIALFSALAFLSVMVPAQVLASKQYNNAALHIFALCFVIGWIIQFTGHLFEGKKPAFMDNLMQLFVAPMFLVMELCFAMKLKPELRRRVEQRAKAL